MDFPIVTDTYQFACTRCGECCFDQQVWLEPLDTWALHRRGPVALHFEGSRCRLQFGRWPGRGLKCEFLRPRFEGDEARGFECSLHGSAAKPYVCSLSPLARRADEQVFRLVPPVEGCPGMGKGAPRPVEHTERMAWSLWFHEHIAPWLNEQTARLAFTYAGEDLDSFLLSLVSRGSPPPHG